jgi:hypothetical protein
MLTDSEIRSAVQKIRDRLNAKFARARRHVSKAHKQLIGAQDAYVKATSASRKSAKLLTESRRRALHAKINRSQKLLTEKLIALYEVQDEHKNYFQVLK